MGSTSTKIKLRTSDQKVFKVEEAVVELYEWDANFVKVDQNTLFDLILAANCLKIESLLDLTCQTIANMIKAKRPEEIRTTFNIKSDYTPEAEEAVRREIKWAFDMLGV
ncbi:hypothetical protein ERO13_D02G086600v2 [Gossypium hirsutum]|uniref:SKP1 component dimerisation domain-containing protein n=2 Tax=Gossypium TaxID=3633 RepID=A0A5D2VUT8_GOSMU|nr:hypothetical protein ERO13_D02G086600v2 [Gossypium hirsutum]TYH83122.1 hypothetical protein ES332_D02G109900v1 [Gossypium tomentosum]TYI92936.1 hypothetical protein E1A91_D02G103400v1 [Gossypium mustelinum]